jgi:hypothetical protein
MTKDSQDYPDHQAHNEGRDYEVYSSLFGSLHIVLFEVVIYGSLNHLRDP